MDRAVGIAPHTPGGKTTVSRVTSTLKEITTMRLSLHPVILGGSLSFEDMLGLAAKLGYEGIDTGFELAREMGAEEFLGLCDQYNVELSVWPMGVEWRQDEDTFQRHLTALPDQAAFAAELNCTRTCTWIPPAVEGDADETRKTWMRRWGEIAKVIAEHGHSFGLEWVAPYHTRAGKNEVVWRMTELLEIEDEIGEPNLGLLVDSYHWFNASQTAAELAAVPVEKVVHVHLNDAPDRPLEEQQDMERLTPGEGIIDLHGFLGALKKMGYRDFLGVEIFNAELKQLPAEISATRVKKACDKLLSEI